MVIAIITVNLVMNTSNFEVQVQIITIMRTTTAIEHTMAENYDIAIEIYNC